MSVHDHHNDPNDPVNQPPKRSKSASDPLMVAPVRDKGMGPGAWMLGLLALVLIGGIIYSMSDRTTTASSTSPTPSSSTNTTTGTTGSGGGSATQPQGPTGPLETKSSGGAPASSPQGETPPGMQSAPGGSSTTTTGPKQ